MPLSLLQFSAVRKNNDGIVQWQTANEINLSYFAVQRSTDGVHFTTLGKVAATGMVAENNYSFTIQTSSGWVCRSFGTALPNTAPTATSYIAGSLCYRSAASSPFRYFPTLPDAVISISDAGGRLLYRTRRNIAAGSNTAIDVSSFGKSVYLLSIHSSACTQTIKLITE